jgi:type 1 glutamine amidotransferase
LPAVNLHCAMHSYRFGDYGRPLAVDADNARWFRFLGLQSSGHGPQAPVQITFTDASHPITRGLVGWTTGPEELYNNLALLGARPLAVGRQDDQGRTIEAVVAWVHEFGPRKTRVFGTTLGHNNATVADTRHLDLIARAVLWATGKLADDGRPVDGYTKK